MKLTVENTALSRKSAYAVIGVTQGIESFKFDAQNPSACPNDPALVAL
jgi:hypothetical protein